MTYSRPLPVGAVALSLCVAALLVTAAPAVAQDDDRALNCDRALAYEDLAGSYTITLGNSILSAPGRPPMTMPTQDVLQGVMFAMGESLVLEAPNNDVTFRFAGTDEPDWRWSTKGALSGATSDDLGVMLGCDINRLPRLVGEGSGRSAEGAPLRLTYRLTVPGEGYLFGQFQWHAQGMTMTRSVEFKAND